LTPIFLHDTFVGNFEKNAGNVGFDKNVEEWGKDVLQITLKKNANFND
jgi:hypothetical protein